jgi:hypothetical protein
MSRPDAGERHIPMFFFISFYWRSIIRGLKILAVILPLPVIFIVLAISDLQSPPKTHQVQIYTPPAAYYEPPPVYYAPPPVYNPPLPHPTQSYCDSLGCNVTVGTTHCITTFTAGIYYSGCTN